MSLEVRPLGEFHPFGFAYARENAGVNIGRAARDGNSNGPTRPVTNAGTPHLPLSLSMPNLDLGAATPDAAILMRGAMGSGDASGQSANAPKSLTGCYSLGEVPVNSQHSLAVSAATAEEELYVAGTTVVWSRGCHGAGTGTLKASFNFEHLKQPIRQCLWARFRTGDADDAFATSSAASKSAKRSRTGSAASDMDLEEDLKQPPDSNGPATERALCVLFRDVASFQFDDGRSYLVNLPFAVHRAFPLSEPAGGLLLQKEPVEPGAATKGSLDPLEQPLLAYNATLYSLMHPLEQPRVIGVFRDPAPGIAPGSSTHRVLSTGSLPFDDAEENVVFVTSGSGTPLVVTFNSSTGKHSAWTFLHSVVDAADRAATFPGAIPPAPSSPLLARPTAAKTTDSARRARPRRPQSHAPKRSSILPAGPETPQFIGMLDDERKSEMPTDDDDEYQRAIVAWQTSPVVFFRKVWEESVAA